MQRELSHATLLKSVISNTAAQFPHFPTSPKHENSTPKFEIHHSCVIQSQIRPQYQVSDDYPTSLHCFG